MLQRRPAQERGYADHGWLKSHHSFSFASYYDPEHMGWGNLRVINEDRIAPSGGFGAHPHRDMEIVSYVMSGSLAHQDNMGNGTQIVPGDVQRMSAGTGVVHSEFNHEREQTTHFLQIWLQPNQMGVSPGYEQKHFEAASKRGCLRLVASPDGAQASVRLHADASIYAGLFDGDEQATLALDSTRKGYLFVVRGSITANDLALGAGDALMVADEAQLRLAQGVDAEVLWFDLSA
jgi:quercetin 2,3-dioxygenase